MLFITYEGKKLTGFFVGLNFLNWFCDLMTLFIFSMISHYITFCLHPVMFSHQLHSLGTCLCNVGATIALDAMFPEARLSCTEENRSLIRPWSQTWLTCCPCPLSSMATPQMEKRSETPATVVPATATATATATIFQMYPSGKSSNEGSC